MARLKKEVLPAGGARRTPGRRPVRGSARDTTSKGLPGEDAPLRYEPGVGPASNGEVVGFLRRWKREQMRRAGQANDPESLPETVPPWDASKEPVMVRIGPRAWAQLRVRAEREGLTASQVLDKLATQYALGAPEEPAVAQGEYRAMLSALIAAERPHELIRAFVQRLDSDAVRWTHFQALDDWNDWCASRGFSPLEAQPEHIQAWQQELADKAVDASDRARRLAAVSLWYRWLADECLVPRNPAAEQPKPKGPSRPRR